MEMYLTMTVLFVLALLMSNCIVLVHEENGAISTFFSKQLTDKRWFITSTVVILVTSLSLSDISLPVYAVGILLAIVATFDLKYYLAPDFMNGFILLAGVGNLLVTHKNLFALKEGIISSICIYFIWLIIYYAFKGAIGGGDFKLLMALSFTLGINNLFLMVFVSVMSVVAIVPFIYLKHKQLKEVSVPLVPFFLFGYIITIKFGDAIIGWYLGGI